jgi:tetratricopeptide (TPR) repeat protein
MKPFETAIYAVLSILVVVFAAKTFLYGGNQSRDPNDSPLYDSTLQRALNNFKNSDLLLGRDSVVSAPSYPQAHNPRQRQPNQGVPAATGTDLAATYVRAGLSFFQKRDYDKALTYLNAAYKLDPTNAQALQYLAATYTNLGKTAEAQEATRKLAALRRSPPLPQPKPGQGTPPQTPPDMHSHNAKDYLDEGMKLYSSGQYEKAVPLLDAAVKFDPKNLRAYYSLANCHYALGDKNKMVQYYQAAVGQAPDDPTANYYLGIALAQSSKPEEAAAAFNKTLKLNPNYTQAHEGLGQLLKAEGKVEEAMKEFQYEIDASMKLIDKDPKNVRSYTKLAQFYLRNRIKLAEGIGLVQRALDIDPGDPAALATSAQLHFRIGNKAKALELIDEAIASKGDNTRYYELLKKSFNRPPVKAPAPKEEEVEEEKEAPDTETK